MSHFPLPHKAKILEIGCGTGGNLSTLIKYGHVTGIELSQAAIEIARKKNIAPILHGALPNDIPKSTEPVDLIALFDVIEHIEDDKAALETCVALLKDSGLLILTVPAFMFLWNQHDIDNHHKRRYRRKDLQRLAKSADLNLKLINYFNFWLFLPTAIAKLARNILPYRTTWHDMKPPAEPINHMLHAILSSEHKLINRVKLPFGTSIIAVLQKANRG